MRTFLKFAALLLAAVLVFGTARYLDRVPRRHPKPQETTAQLRETEPPVVETTAAPTTAPAETEPEQTEPKEERFLLTFVGDCTFGSNASSYFADFGFVKTVGEDYEYPFRNVIGYFENDEASFLNLEGPLCDSGNAVQKKHTFRGPTEFIQILTENSVEAVSIANNHSLDYGQTGYDSTVQNLNAAGIPFVERDSSTIFTTENGLTIGMYGAVYYLLDVEDMKEEIRQLKEAGCDLIIFAPHWGTEGSYQPTTEQTEVGHEAIAAGADIVWGSHPHVLQPIEEYGNGIIFYSLGNFSFGGNGYPQDYDSALIQQEIIRDADGIRLGETITIPVNVSSVSNRNNYQPTPYPENSEEYDRVTTKLNGTFSGPGLKIS